MHLPKFIGLVFGFLLAICLLFLVLSLAVMFDYNGISAIRELIALIKDKE